MKRKSPLISENLLITPSTAPKEKIHEDIHKAPEIYDRYLVSNKVEIAFNTIDDATLKIILDAALNMARKLKG